MKVLFVTPYITNTADAKLLRNKTGFGYMVNDIAGSVSQLAEVDVYIINALLAEQRISGFTVVGRNWRKFIMAFKFRSLHSWISYLFKYKPSFLEALRALYKIWAVEEIDRFIKRYDLLHIHGNGEYTLPCIKLCLNHSIPFIVTLHGLDSFSDSINCSSAFKRLEKDFIKEAYYNHFPVTVISSGIKYKIYNYLGQQDNTNFKVICNGCVLNKSNPIDLKVREKYRINNKDFLFLYVGNISKNKNQIQAVRSFNLLPDNLKERASLLLVGGGDDNEVSTYIKNNRIENRVKLAGSVPKDIVGAYYREANATILTSIAEGFGLSIIEGFSYGVPALCFKDLDAFNDLFDDQSMIAVDSRDDISLCQGMEAILLQEFDKEHIIEHAKKFSLNRMAEHYYDYYCDLIKHNQLV